MKEFDGGHLLAMNEREEAGEEQEWGHEWR